ncbi:MAG: hypothetical protein AABN95_27105, partial [Acidobacteriota bacterium]
MRRLIFMAGLYHIGRWRSNNFEVFAPVILKWTAGGPISSKAIAEGPGLVLMMLLGVMKSVPPRG